MTLFLRDNKNETIVDIEFNGSDGIDLDCVVCIQPYSRLLLEAVGPYKQIEIISIFDQIQELRGWLFEQFLPFYKGDDPYNDALKELRSLLKEVSGKLNLAYVED